mmetsp:Transcript_33844/g.106926  ORF Transcript_33844/g.106926 Transcript_33844/m.106926 type:complete len:247 (+) Transcript_33844:360-1100(+)
MFRKVELEFFAAAAVSQASSAQRAKPSTSAAWGSTQTSKPSPLQRSRSSPPSAAPVSEGSFRSAKSLRTDVVSGGSAQCCTHSLSVVATCTTAPSSAAAVALPIPPASTICSTWRMCTGAAFAALDAASVVAFAAGGSAFTNTGRGWNQSRPPKTSSRGCTARPAPVAGRGVTTPSRAAPSSSSHGTGAPGAARSVTLKRPGGGGKSPAAAAAHGPVMRKKPVPKSSTAPPPSTITAVAFTAAPAG